MRCARACPTAATSSTGPRTTPRSSGTSRSRSSTAAIPTPPRSSTPLAVPPASRTRASGASWIVEESLADAESLATLLQQGPLPAEEARRIAGEAASALEKARQRGLHHLRLTPHAVLRTQDGTVKVTGTAIAAGIDGYEEPDDVAATRADTVALVALAYAALTGRWPLSAVVHGVEPAPRVVGGVAAPSEIAAGVPSDLDALCRLTLNDDAGPLTPGDFATQIAPWASNTVRAPATEPTVVLDPSGRSREAGRAGHDRGDQ